MTHRPAAVIGAGGLIGRRLVDALTRLRHPVATFTRGRRFCDGAGRPAPGLLAARTVFHLTTSVNARTAVARPDLVAADHQALLYLLDALGRGDHRPFLVLPGPAEWLYDPAVRPPYRENSPVRPESLFGTVRMHMENAVLRRIDEVRPMILRLGAVYGPGRRPAVTGGPWPESGAVGEPLRIRLERGAIRDYVYVDDVVDALVRLHTRPVLDSPARVLNIGSGVPVPCVRLAHAIRESRGGRPVHIRRERSRHLPRPDTWLDVGAAARTLGWRAATSLASGLRSTWPDAG